MRYACGGRHRGPSNVNPIAVLLLSLAAGTTLDASADAAGSVAIAQEPASPERIQVALAALDEAFDQKQPDLRVAALLEHGWIDDEQVIRRVVMGLYDKHMGVRIVSVECLEGMTSDRSLAALTRFFERRHHKLRLDVELWPRIFRALGRRQDPAAIPALLTGVRGQMEALTLRARFFALANIRSTESIEGILTVLEDLDSHYRDRSLPDARTALYVLTGQALEGNSEQLREWWSAAGDGFVLPSQAPRLEGESWTRWREFWELPERPPEPPEPDQDGSDDDA